MGIAKSMWMDRIEDEAWEDRAEWIREQLNDPEADEFTKGWDDLSEDYDTQHQFDNYDRYEDDWIVEGKNRLEIFNENIEATREILATVINKKYEKNLIVMLFGHVVAAVEAYLSSAFIHYAISSEDHMRKLVENDPEFAKRKFTVKEIFTKRAELKSDISEYLRGLIFHDIAKVKPLYSSVLSIDMGDSEWLFRAVLVRHHCVHRAGYDKDGNEVDLTKKDVVDLIDHSTKLIHKIESDLIGMPADDYLF
ncbi:MAG: hypothetical protein V4730_02940 [Pseudomonadota bacterium]